MPAPEIQISKNGLKLSYQRYLADSAAGFVVILLVLLAVSNKIPLPFLDHSLESLTTLSKDIKLFTLLIIFLLATPLGLTINGLSWFLFGYFRGPCVEFWFKHESCFDPTMKAMYYDEKIKDFLGVTPQNAYEMSELYGDYLHVFFQERIGMEHVTGLSRFVRNILFISFISFFAILHIMFWNDAITFHNAHGFLCFSLFAVIIASFLYSLLASYSSLRRLSIIYILCISKEIKPSPPDSPEKLIEKIHAAYFDNGSENLYLHQFP